MGRPEKQEAERRQVYIMVRLTKEEKEAVKLAAKAVMRSPSEFARWAVLEAVLEQAKKSVCG